MFNRLCILLDAFLIEVFPLYGVVFAHSCCRGPLLGVVLVDARECEPLLLDVCLPCDVCISGGFSQCFSGFFWLVLVFLGRVQQELQLLYNITRQYKDIRVIKNIKVIKDIKKRTPILRKVYSLLTILLGT